MASSLMSSVPLASAKPTPFPTGLTSSASNARLPFAPPLCVVPLKARSGAVRCAAKDDFVSVSLFPHPPPPWLAVS